MLTFSTHLSGFIYSNSGDIRCIPSPQPVLQYSSAFDDEVAEIPEEEPDVPEGILESVLEEPPEPVVDAPPEPQLEEESPAEQAQAGRPAASVVHGPYYYFYQGRCFSALLPQPCGTFWMLMLFFQKTY